MSHQRIRTGNTRDGFLAPDLDFGSSQAVVAKDQVFLVGCTGLMLASPTETETSGGSCTPGPNVSPDRGDAATDAECGLHVGNRSSRFPGEGADLCHFK